MHLYTLYPSFVLEDSSNFSKEENALLSELAWKTCHLNDNTEKTHQLQSGQYFTRPRINMLEEYVHEPVVKKLALLADYYARLYLKEAYGYSCTLPIKLMAEPFCQDGTTGTHGIMTHSHRGKPLLVTYYPSVKINPRSESKVVGNSGLNGQVDFYDPSGEGKRWWNNHNPAHLTASVARFPVSEGSILVFEGHLPHGSCSFEGEERVCIPVICYPQMPQKNGGLSLRELEHICLQSE
jgi:hypothetical protein